ncbi:hypothetical protein [Herbidospora daliensis]|uniref:hypothetical protein n=1 Tax=Herbidospora daliensis TaxID=295585 RepID=UPI0007835EC5|nr:hypothetical protein [Herbidospora daliensis]
MTTYQRGETVRISFEAKLHDAHDDGTVHLRVPGNMGDDFFTRLDFAETALTIERTLPADGDAQPGDVWRDASGGMWFAQTVDTDDAAGEPYVILIPAQTSRWGRRPTHDDLYGVNREFGPMALIWRDERPGGDV